MAPSNEQTARGLGQHPLQPAADQLKFHEDPSFPTKIAPSTSAARFTPHLDRPLRVVYNVKSPPKVTSPHYAEGPIRTWIDPSASRTQRNPDRECRLRLTRSLGSPSAMHRFLSRPPRLRPIPPACVAWADA